MTFNIQDIRQGKESSFKKVVTFFYPRLFKFALIYTEDDETAKDLVQETFLSLWENRLKLHDSTDLVPFLMVICRNKCLNNIRNHKSEYLSRIDHMPEAEEIYIRTNEYILEDNALTLLEADDLQKEIKEAIALLKDKTQQIFYQRYYDGLKVKEIADQMDLSEKTIEYHLTKALQTLREKLSPEHFSLIILFLLLQS